MTDTICVCGPYGTCPPTCRRHPDYAPPPPVLSDAGVYAATRVYMDTLKSTNTRSAATCTRDVVAAYLKVAAETGR